jgi:hypothetical protein
MDYWFLLEVLRKYNGTKVEKIFGHYYFDGKNKTSSINTNLECRNTVLKHLVSHFDLLQLIRYSWSYIFRFKFGITF